MKSSKTETGFQQPTSGLQKTGINIPSSTDSSDLF